VPRFLSSFVRSGTYLLALWLLRRSWRRVYAAYHSRFRCRASVSEAIFSGPFCQAAFQAQADRQQRSIVDRPGTVEALLQSAWRPLYVPQRCHFHLDSVNLGPRLIRRRLGHHRLRFSGTTSPPLPLRATIMAPARSVAWRNGSSCRCE
jgi:hypothetical protein